ncbi:B12-binding domain-containing radical SAM protein [Patescibacteria group bacterium]|nr:B12-binding domain-containing radical SAM protein [Patescibacteria group bacterium]
MSTLVLLQQYKFTSLGPMYLSSVLKSKGHNCVLLIKGLEKDIIESIRKIKPDLIGFQVFTGQQQWALKYTKLIKENFSIPVIFGGNHITHNPDIIEKNECIDFICRGEGEYAILELLEKMEQKKDLTDIKNIWARQNKNIYKNDVRDLANPDDLPFPDRELYYRYPLFRSNSVRRFITGRGCPFQCTFCHNHLDIELYKGKGVWARKRSALSVIEEIKQVKNKYKMKIVDFSPDDFFLSDSEWALDFLELYEKEIKTPFVFNTRPQTINMEIAKALKKAGCRGVAISIESADDKLRNEVLKKYTKINDIKEAIKCLKNEKLITKTYNMIGIPGETIEQALETLKLNMELKPTWARCAIISPYPNTNIWDAGIEAGCLDPLSADQFSDTYIDETLFKISNKNEFINLQRFFAICARFPFIFPLVKRIIKFPRNKIFDIIGVLSFGYYGVKYFGHSFRDIVKYAGEFIKTSQPC